MSLDVYLSLEVDTGGPEPFVVELFNANITHNLNRMADAAGIYREVWRPEEVGIEIAGQLIEPLRDGIDRLEASPAQFRALNPENGWGKYDDFVPWLKRYLTACETHPKAKVQVWR